MWKQYVRSSQKIKHFFAASCYFAEEFMIMCRGHSRACKTKRKDIFRQCEARTVAAPLTAPVNAVTPL